MIICTLSQMGAYGHRMTKVSGYSAKDTKSFRDAGLDAGTPTQIVHEHQDGLHILV